MLSWNSFQYHPGNRFRLSREMLQRREFSSIWPVALSMALLAPLSACHRTFKEPVSIVKANDKGAASQLTAGFYPVEADSWRWTAKKFSVILAPPPGAERNGAKLVVHLFISAAQLQKLGPMTLCAAAGSDVLDAETFSKAGPYTYSRDLPPALADTDVLPVRFSFDRASAPSQTDARELAAIVTSVGLEPK